MFHRPSNLKFNVIPAALFTAFLSLIITSCSVIQSTDYLGHYKDSALVKLNPINVEEPVIEVGDFLEITFAGKSPEVTAALNNYGNSKAESEISGGLSGGMNKKIEVERDGTINLPLIGIFKVTGLTRSQVKEMLTREVSRLLKDPIVYMAPVTSKITLLGQVKGPATYEFSQTKISIFEALSRAGDVSDYSITDKVKVYRDVSGKREIGTLNLNDSSLFDSPYFYLKNNDMVYVPAQREKVVVAKRNQIIPLISYGISLLSIFFTFLIYFKK